MNEKIDECNFKFAKNYCSFSDNECSGEDKCILYQTYLRLWDKPINVGLPRSVKK